MDIWANTLPIAPTYPVILSVCPPPAIDGSIILAQTTCTLIDISGTVYQFDGTGPTNYPNFSNDWEFTANGVPQTSGAALERHTNGQIYYRISSGNPGSPLKLWFLWTSSDKPQTSDPALGPVGNVFINQTTSVGYRTAAAMISAAAANQTLLIPTMPNGIAQWWDGGVVNVAGVTLTGASGAILGGPSFLGQSSVVALANNLTVKNLTLAYGNNGNPTAGVRQDNTFHGLLVDGCIIHDFDHGILTGISSGGTTTVRNTTIFNCGDLSGSNTHGSTHNAYIGNEDAVDVQNVTSYNTVSGGHTWKTRAKSGTIGTTTGCIFAQLGGDSTACIDIPCGGTYQIKNCVIERGPNAENNRFLTFGVEITIPANCDMTGRAQSITISNCWFIDDGPLNSSATKICDNLFSSTGTSVFVQNCKIVSNPNTSPVVFGSNVTDGGGNIFYASRAAAIAAGENIPPAYDGTLACLPPVPGADQLTSLLATMSLGTWKAVPRAAGTRLADVVYGANAGDDQILAAAIAANTGPRSIMSVWGGAALDTTNRRLFICNGGHHDYHGNEAYVFDLAILRWSNISKPTDPSLADINQQFMSDGTPAVPHTYGCPTWDPSQNRVMFLGAGLWNGGGTRIAWYINPATMVRGQTAGSGGTNSWAQLAQWQGDLDGNTDASADYDSATGHVWAGGLFSNGIDEYNPTTNTWTTHGSVSPNNTFGGTSHPNGHGCVQPGARFLFVGDSQTYEFSIATGTAGTVSKWNTTGDLTAQNANFPGLQWHSPSGKFVAWSGGTTLYTIDPNVKQWVAHTASPDGGLAANIPPAATTNGTHGRFRYSSFYNCFLAVNEYDQDVYIYKPDF